MLDRFGGDHRTYHTVGGLSDKGIDFIVFGGPKKGGSGGVMRCWGSATAASSCGHLGCLCLWVPIGIAGVAVGGSGRWSFLAWQRAGGGHRTDSLDAQAWALHLVLQEHVVLWGEPHTGPGGQGWAQQGQTSRLVASAASSPQALCTAP